MFRLLRFYSIASFVIICLTAAFLALFYRQVTMRWIDHLAKNNNIVVAQTAANSIAPELLTYLGTTAYATESELRAHPLPAGLSAEIHRVAQDAMVNRIEVFNRNGLLVFSTRAMDTSVSNQTLDPIFQTALNGNVSSSMNFRDALDLFTEAAAEDNRMRIYTPVRRDADSPVLGVFETLTDMSQLIAESDRMMLYIAEGAGLILALLYIMLFIVVRHAKNIIDAQQKTIEERTASLETLSRRLLKGDELKKKKIATDLHEGLAQTLSAIKINVESSSNRLRKYDANTQPLDSIVPVLQSAIHEVRTIATELHPSSLDDLGLLPTLNWYCREFERQHPEISIQRELSLPEGTIPSHLKIVIYRIIESAFKNIAKYSNTDQIRFALHLADDAIHLVIGDSPTVPQAVAAIARFDPGADPQLRFAEMKERTSLSGGAFSTTLENPGWVTLRASWACIE